MQYFDIEESVKNLYGFSAKVIGLDDETFALYARQCGTNLPATGLEAYPVIIENYIPIKKSGNEPGEYREVLDIPEREEINILYGSNADLSLSLDFILRSETMELPLHVLAATPEHPPIPPLVYEYAFDTDRRSQFETIYLKIYMPHSVFRRFLKDDRVIHTYGKLKEYDNPTMDRDTNPIINYIYLERNKNYEEQELIDNITDAMEHTGLKDQAGVLPSYYINDSESWEYRTVENMQRQRLLDQISEVLKRLLIIGGIILTAFFTLVSLMNYILTSIYVRKRELSVLKSVGMGYVQLKRMLLYETGILILCSSVLGVFFGFFLATIQLHTFSLPGRQQRFFCLPGWWYCWQ